MSEYEVVKAKLDNIDLRLQSIEKSLEKVTGFVEIAKSKVLGGASGLMSIFGKGGG